MSDEELFTRIKEGDGEALSLLYDRHALRVARIAGKWIHDKFGVEEVVQDVFTRIWTTTAFTPDKGQFANWIAVVTRRITIDHLRRMQRKQDRPESSRIEFLADRRPHDEEVETHWFREDLAKSLHHLRPDDRVVIDLAYFKGHTLSEIAKILNIPLGTVKTRLHLALKALKSSMSDWSWEG